MGRRPKQSTKKAAPAAPTGEWAPPCETKPVDGEGPSKSTDTGTTAEPPPVVQPQIRVERVANSRRTVFRVYGHDAAATAYIQRERQLEQEKHELEAGKVYFRSLAGELRAQHGAETVIYCSPFGSVDVIYSSTRKALNPTTVARAAQSPRIGTLVEQSEVVRGNDWSRLLDGAFVQMPDRSWVSVRQAIEQGLLPLKIDQKTTLVSDFEQRVVGLAPILSPDETEAVEVLQASGYNAATVRPGK